MADTLADELLTINSIYPEDTLTPVDGVSSNRICTFRLPSTPSVVLRLEFPASYPEFPPVILGTESVGSDVPKGFGKELVDRTKSVLEKAWKGEAVMFDLVEELEQQLAESLQPQEQEPEFDESHQIRVEKDLGPEPPWILIPAVTVHKSVFLARCAPVASPDQAKSYLTHLLKTDKKAAKATHNISAYRIHGESGTQYQDCDDDGETAAGGRMLHLMQLMDVWNVMVVVTRWYGGVLLGPDRFRIINNTARDVLVAGGFAKEKKK